MKKFLMIFAFWAVFIFPMADLFAQAGGPGAAGGAGGGQGGAAASGNSGAGAQSSPRIPGPPQPSSSLPNTGGNTFQGDLANPGGGIAAPSAGGNSLQNQPGSSPAGVPAPPGPAMQNQRSNFGATSAENLRDRMGANRDIRDNLRNNRQDSRQDLRQDRQDIRQDRQDIRQDARQDVRESGDRWRFVLHNGEWWYWMPDNSWMFYRDNNWSRYDADNFRPSGRYSAAYRGPARADGIYYDESGRQYRRDYSPVRRALREGLDIARGATQDALRGGPVEVQPGPGNTEINVAPNTGGTASGTGPNGQR
jgi:hypothetical protein